MENLTFEPRLYIIMREDLWDMNPGKGMAQAAHAQALFDQYETEMQANAVHEKYQPEREFLDAVSDWRGVNDRCRGFGTTIVLSAPKSQWMDISMGFEHYGYVEDPTYPYRNHYGQVFTSSEDTCMWAFATTEEEADYVKNIPLHP